MEVIAVDCGGTNLTVARAAHAAAPTGRVMVSTPADAGGIPRAVIAAIGTLGAAGAIGVAVAGLVDHETGVLEWMPHRPGSAAIAADLGAATGLPVSVDNDANAAALAEAIGGAGVGHRMVLTVTVGTGIGAGLVIDGRVERGRGYLGEVGHMGVDPGGLACPCGRRGCWETVASGTALDRIAREAGFSDGKALVAAASSGDAAARDQVASVGMAFGRGLADLVAVLDPDVIVVGGGVASVGDLYLEPARRALAEATSGVAHRRPTPVVPAAFGYAAGIVGAALMAGAPL